MMTNNNNMKENYGEKKFPIRWSQSNNKKSSSLLKTVNKIYASEGGLLNQYF